MVNFLTIAIVRHTESFLTRLLAVGNSSFPLTVFMD